MIASHNPVTCRRFTAGRWGPLAWSMTDTGNSRTVEVLPAWQGATLCCAGVVLHQKALPALATITALVELPKGACQLGCVAQRLQGESDGCLELSAAGHPVFREALGSGLQGSLVLAQWCADQLVSSASQWASTVLGCAVTMSSCEPAASKSFANAGQYLLLTRESLHELGRRTPPTAHTSAFNLRPNLLVSSDGAPNAEDRCTFHCEVG